MHSRWSLKEVEGICFSWDMLYDNSADILLTFKKSVLKNEDVVQIACSVASGWWVFDCLSKIDSIIFSLWKLGAVLLQGVTCRSTAGLNTTEPPFTYEN
jgi:hypothetical protein